MSASFKPDVCVGGRRVVSALTLLATILLAGTAVLGESPIPEQTPDDLAHGRRLFQGQCARCHGMDGAGGTGPGLNRSVLGRASDDQARFSIIKEGKSGAGLEWRRPRRRQLVHLLSGSARRVDRQTEMAFPVHASCTHDWDSNQIPILLEGTVGGRQRKLLATANRNAFYYLLDRETGEFLLGSQYARQTWAKGG
jgi:cytochrome c2